MLTIDVMGDPRAISFMICYMIAITLWVRSTLARVETVVEVFITSCMILLIAIGANSDPIILGIVIKMYVNYIITAVVVIDLTNEWIMKHRINIPTMTGGIAHLMKDLNIGHSDLTQLMPARNDPRLQKKENYESIPVSDSSEILV